MGSHQQTKMGEGNKQVRVDNWGIFFLQRLQMFFNKTDYCDLTLQFEGNVQLKVHRLVMNACTEYFQFLEQTCEMIEDVLIMPSDLQADVVLPIVNFMYTGMLEFHMSVFDKLYKTAELMNITVLTKLLDAQKSPIAPLTKHVKKSVPVPHTWNLQGKKIVAKTVDSDLPATLPGRKLPVWKRKSAPLVVQPSFTRCLQEPKRIIPKDPLAIADTAPKPTRFEWPDDDFSSISLFDSSFDDISYTSRPLLTQEDEPKPSTSFDRIKDTSYNSRRSTNYTNSAVDIDEMKDYVKEQKIRSNLAESEDEDAADDMESYESSTITRDSLKRTFDKVSSVSDKRVRFSLNEKENQVKQTKFNITPSSKSATDVNHTKIISEVLKKYPHLVKKNKNIRLKILAKSGNSPSSDSSSKLSYRSCSSRMRVQLPSSQHVIKSAKIIPEDDKKKVEGPWKCLRCSTPTETCEFVLYYLYRKHMTDVHNEKFDSRMCKYCGHKSSKHNMLMYHQYTKHGVKPPAAYNFPKCSLCPYIALTETLLIKHKLNHTKFELQCLECKVAFSNQHSLTAHVRITGHTGKTGKTNYDCQYCTKKYQSGANLFSHIKMQHRDEARRDGIVSIDEIEDVEDEEDLREDHDEEQDDNEPEYITPEIIGETNKEKIKILSNVKLPAIQNQHDLQSMEAANVTLEPSSEAEALSNVASGIATSLGLIDIVVLDDNQQYILHSGDQQLNQPEFILPELADSQTYTTGQHIGEVITTDQNLITQSVLSNTDIASTDELVMVLTDHDYGDGNNEVISNDNSNIVVVYSHPVEGQENQFITSQGNIMINSQTGLIELRNPTSIATTTAQQFVNSTVDNDNSHIESIEMIKREIDSQSELKAEHYSDDIKANLPHQDTATSGDVEPISQSADIDNETDKNETRMVLNSSQDEVQFNTVEDVVTEHEHHSDVTDDTSITENPQDDIPTGSVDEQDGILNEEQPMEIDSECSEVIPETDHTPNLAQPSVEENEKDSENVRSDESHKENNEHNDTAEENGILSSAEDVAQVQNSEPVGNNSLSEPSEYMCEPMEVDERHVEEDERHVEEDEHHVEEDVVDSVVEHEKSENSTQNGDESMEDGKSEATLNIETNKEESVIVEHPSENDEEALEESNKLIQENPEAGEFDDHEQHVAVSDPQEENTNNQEPEIEEENVHSELHDSHSVNSQSHDENSQTSQASQSSSSHKEDESSFVMNSSQSAKIILEDWDDTDSQQSEHVARAGNTVHRLIDDWADDDDDEGKKGSV